MDLCLCMWFYAIGTPHDAGSFSKACALFQRIYGNAGCDLLLAELYSRMKLGGEDSLSEAAAQYLKTPAYSGHSGTIASGLMWMKAYKREHEVLQHMLSAHMQMTPKMQARLQMLSSGGDKAPAGFDAVSDANKVYFDVSAMSWKPEDFHGFFDNLAFRDQQLRYALAIRDEAQELTLPQYIRLPDGEALNAAIGSAFAEEYPDGARASLVRAVAMSDGAEEEMDAILAGVDDCPQLGVLLHLAQIGRSLSIKFYVLFLPPDADAAAQKKQALALSQKLGHTANMWEQSLKNTMRKAIEQALNRRPEQSAPEEIYY